MKVESLEAIQRGELELFIKEQTRFCLTVLFVQNLKTPKPQYLNN